MQPKRRLRTRSAPREGLRKVDRRAGSASASREWRGVDSCARRLRLRVVRARRSARGRFLERCGVPEACSTGMGRRQERERLVGPISAVALAASRCPGRCPVRRAAAKAAAATILVPLSLAGAHGVGAAQGQVSLGQHVGRVSQQAQPPPGARQCGPLQPARSQVCVASSRGQQPPASESPARGRCGPRSSELSPPPRLLFLFGVLSLFGLRCGWGRLPWLPDCEPSQITSVQGVSSAPCPLLPRRNGFSAEGSV